VGGGVGEAEVGLDLGDAAGEALAVEIADEELAEEGSGDDLGGAGVEGSWEELRGVTGLRGGTHIFRELEIALLSAALFFSIGSGSNDPLIAKRLR
jgi:hypothetical protein